MTTDLRKAAEAAREALARVPAGLTASYDEKDAEWRGHDKAGDRANKIVREVRDQCAAAVAALTAALEGEGWRPIESAPEGEPVLLCFGEGFHPLVGHREGSTWLHLTKAWSIEKFETAPTHWMPLPTPPAGE